MKNLNLGIAGCAGNNSIISICDKFSSPVETYLISNNVGINYLTKKLIMLPNFLVHLILLLPNPKLFVPRSECFMIVSENQIG